MCCYYDAQNNAFVLFCDVTRRQSEFDAIVVENVIFKIQNEVNIYAYVKALGDSVLVK